MNDIMPFGISYSALKEITEKRLRNRLEMKAQAGQPYDYAKFHAQGVAIVEMWYEIVAAGNAPAEQTGADYVYFRELLEPSRW